MTLAQARKLIAEHDALNGPDRLRWMGFGTHRYLRNCDLIGDALTLLDEAAQAKSKPRKVTPKPARRRDRTITERNGAET